MDGQKIRHETCRFCNELAVDHINEIPVCSLHGSQASPKKPEKMVPMNIKTPGDSSRSKAVQEIVKIREDRLSCCYPDD